MRRAMSDRGLPMSAIFDESQEIVAGDLDDHTRSMLEAPLFRTILKLAAPNAFVMVAQMAISLMEVFFIAKLNIDALAGVSQVFPLLSLVAALSQGSVGGSVMSAVARALGSGRREDANRLVWCAVAIAIPLGLISTIIFLYLGPSFYAATSASPPALTAALAYSNLVFGGAVLIWIFNLLMSAVRGTGNLVVPLTIVCGGALLLIPLSPVLISGLGPIPDFGVRGGAIALLIYYGAGSVAFAAYLWTHQGALKPSARPPALRLKSIWDILRVGSMSALVGGSTNLTLAILTGFVGAHGVAAVAGYGAGSRLEFLLVPISYGIGGPVGILVGTNLGAGNIRRALRVVCVGLLVAGLSTEAIGLAAACWPDIWLEAFSKDPAVIAAGSAYLRTVGPFFGFFGMGYALYCGGQGAGRIGWSVAGALARACIAIAGGYFVNRINGDIGGIFWAAALGMVAFGCLGLPSVLFKIGYRDKSRV
jgi:putative MATE family efflux protein